MALTECLGKCRQSRKLVVTIVFTAFFLDNTQISAVVRIIPDYVSSLDLRQYVVTNSFPDPVLLDGDQIDAVTRHSSNAGSSPATGHPYMVASPSTRSVSARGHEVLERVRPNIELLFASKAVIQLIASPLIGLLTNRIGYNIPIGAGCLLMMVSTIMFAFGESYTVFFAAKVVQGIGSSCSTVSGMGLLAERFPGDRERGAAMGVTLGGIGLGMLLGAPFGGAMYEFVGKEGVFLVLTSLALLNGILIMLVLQPWVRAESQERSSIKQLMTDPYILLASGSILLSNIGLPMIETSLPVWMTDRMNAAMWQQGTALVPLGIAYMIAACMFGPLAHRIGRWLSDLIGMVLISVCLLGIPFSKRFFHLLAPNFGLAFAIGMVHSSMMPLVGHLVDLRHVRVYGNVYAIADVAFSLGYAIGPVASGPLVKTIGFDWMLWGLAIVTVVFAPLMIFLRNPPGDEGKLRLTKQTTRSQVNDDEADDPHCNKHKETDVMTQTTIC